MLTTPCLVQFYTVLALFLKSTTVQFSMGSKKSMTWCLTRDISSEVTLFVTMSRPLYIYGVERELECILQVLRNAQPENVLEWFTNLLDKKAHSCDLAYYRTSEK